MTITQNNSNIPQAEELYQTLLEQIKKQKSAGSDFHLVGLASGGAWVAARLAKDLNLPNYGVINVSFHRDDYAERGVKAFNSAEGMLTKLPFVVDGAHIILVDDVLGTGRTVRAGLNELFDYGRPAKVDLAVLVDRHGRQLPVEANFKGADVKVANAQILVLDRCVDGSFSFSTEVE